MGVAEYEGGRCEDLALWKVSPILARELRALTRRSPLSHHPALCAEIEAKAITIGSAIAEGFNHGQNGELLRQLYRARGASGALRSCLLLANDLSGTEKHADELNTAIRATEYCHEHLSAWATKLLQAEHRGITPAVAGVPFLSGDR